MWPPDAWRWTDLERLNEDCDPVFQAPGSHWVLHQSLSNLESVFPAFYGLL